MAIITWFLRPGRMDKQVGRWAPDALSRICDRQRLVDLGVKYRQISGEDQPDTLLQLLMRDHTGNIFNRKKYLEQKIALDFQADNTVMIDGWLLSITEARQCALLSLEATKE